MGPGVVSTATGSLLIMDHYKLPAILDFEIGGVQHLPPPHPSTSSASDDVTLATDETEWRY